MHLTIIGAGYVGLATGTCLADAGHTVTCVDLDRDRIKALNAGKVPIFEPGLSDLITANREAGRLRFSTDGHESAKSAEVVFLAVGTPSAATGEIDLSGIEAAARQIAPALKPRSVVAIKSTVVAGTARKVAGIIADIRGKKDCAVVSNPEFLREGSAIEDFMQADRIVVGADEAWAGAVMEKVYEPLRKRDIPYLVASTVDAELVKYTANAFLALKIGFINNVADLCEQAGADIGAVTEGVGLDHRIGRAFLSPGPGFGGSCFPKDLRALAATGRDLGAPQTLIECVLAENEQRKLRLAQRISDTVEPRNAGQQVCVLGVAFKANTDDVREAPALTIVPELLKTGLRVTAHDPKAQREAERHLEGTVWFDDPYDAARGADCVVILTEWDEYRKIDARRLARVMRGRTVIDYRNILDPQHMNDNGLDYVGLGRAAQPPRRGRTRSLAGAPDDPRKAANPTVI